MMTQIASKNPHAKILSQHGREVLSLFRKAEKTGNKISSWRNHRMFDLRCKHNDVTPTSIKLFSNVQGLQADNILRRAERKLLEVRIRQSNFTLQKLKIDEENALSQLCSKLREPEVDQLRTLLTKSK